MQNKLEFFYDYVSSYSYMANSQLRRIAGDRVVYRPMFLGAVMEATGNRPPAAVPAKQRYLLDDLERWAARYGVRFRMNSRFPQNTLAALRLALVAGERGRFDALHPLLFDAMWVHDRDLGDSTVLAELAGAAGLDAEQSLAAIQQPAVKAALKANTDEAVRRGAFGAPTFFVGDEMFFGNDRFDFIAAALAAPASG
ncbi:MAG TPA: 2-hydroxychromene-2-carboxylate isomerase [Woeseiaceae bacterium]|nr:2-hydroxychromene-2-carboxylate isomerase [Woeseiaceae bacterium]